MLESQMQVHAGCSLASGYNHAPELSLFSDRCFYPAAFPFPSIGCISRVLVLHWPSSLPPSPPFVLVCSHWRLAILVAFVLALCMFPLWPNMVRIWIWYAAVTLLLALLGVSIVRYLAFAAAWIAGYEFWLFPNFWLSDLPWEMVTPIYTIDKASAGQRWMRLAMVAAAAACVYYVVTAPPSEFEGFLEHQKKLVSDLYAGTLLSDGSDAGGTGGGGKFGKDKFASMGYGKDRKRSHLHNIPDIDSFEEMWREEDNGGSSTAPGAAAGGADGAAAAGADGVAGAAVGTGGSAAAAGPDMDAMLDSHDADADAAEAREE